MIFHVMCSIEIYSNRKTVSTHKGSGITVGGGLFMIDILCAFQVTSIKHQANFPVDTNPNSSDGGLQADVTSVVLGKSMQSFIKRRLCFENMYFSVAIDMKSYNNHSFSSSINSNSNSFFFNCYISGVQRYKGLKLFDTESTLNQTYKQFFCCL